MDTVSIEACVYSSFFFIYGRSNTRMVQVIDEDVLLLQANMRVHLFHYWLFSMLGISVIIYLLHYDFVVV